mgnify:CR=1 FL=1
MSDDQPSGRDWAVLDRLIAIIEARRDANPRDSHTARLLAKGRVKIAQKLGEEALETALASVAEGADDVIGESADLLFHWLVLMADMGIDPQQVLARLVEREGLSGVAEKAARGE